MQTKRLQDDVARMVLKGGIMIGIRPQWAAADYLPLLMYFDNAVASVLLTVRSPARDEFAARRIHTPPATARGMRRLSDTRVPQATPRRGKCATFNTGSLT